MERCAYSCRKDIIFLKFKNIQSFNPKLRRKKMAELIICTDSTITWFPKLAAIHMKFMYMVMDGYSNEK